jgi:hypothetical protein
MNSWLKCRRGEEPVGETERSGERGVAVAHGEAPATYQDAARPNVKTISMRLVAEHADQPHRGSGCTA